MLNIKGYQDIKLICQTQLSHVYLARHMDSGTNRVLKLRELPRARAEFEFTASASARNVVKVHDFSPYHGESDTDMIQLFGRQPLGYFSMEHVEGLTLGQMAGKQQFTPIQAVTAMLTVSRALLPLWINGKIHADIKPGNIIVRTDFGPVIIDFGIGSDYAYGLQPSIAEMPFYGTLAYGAPERSYAGAKPHPSWDMFSIGLTTYNLITGRHLTDWLQTQRPESSAPTSAMLRHFDPLTYFDDQRIPMQLLQFLGQACHQEAELRLGDPRRFVKKLEDLYVELSAG